VRSMPLASRVPSQRAEPVQPAEHRPPILDTLQRSEGWREPGAPRRRQPRGELDLDGVAAPPVLPAVAAPAPWPSAPPLELMRITEGWWEPEPQPQQRRQPQARLDHDGAAAPVPWPSAPPLELMRFTEGWRELEPQRRRKPRASRRSPP
jgi:hypothetical protein